jgi:hypothetical protein
VSIKFTAGIKTGTAKHDAPVIMYHFLSYSLTQIAGFACDLHFTIHRYETTGLCFRDPQVLMQSRSPVASTSHMFASVKVYQKDK